MIALFVGLGIFVAFAVVVVILLTILIINKKSSNTPDNSNQSGNEGNGRILQPNNETPINYQNSTQNTSQNTNPYNSPQNTTPYNPPQNSPQNTTSQNLPIYNPPQNSHQNSPQNTTHQNSPQNTTPYNPPMDPHPIDTTPSINPSNAQLRYEKALYAYNLNLSEYNKNKQLANNCKSYQYFDINTKTCKNICPDGSVMRDNLCMKILDLQPYEKINYDTNTVDCLENSVSVGDEYHCAIPSNYMSLKKPPASTGCKTIFTTYFCDPDLNTVPLETNLSQAKCGELGKTTYYRHKRGGVVIDTKNSYDGKTCAFLLNKNLSYDTESVWIAKMGTAPAELVVGTVDVDETTYDNKPIHKQKYELCYGRPIADVSIVPVPSNIEYPEDKYVARMYFYIGKDVNCAANGGTYDNKNVKARLSNESYMIPSDAVSNSIIYERCAFDFYYYVPVPVKNVFHVEYVNRPNYE